MVILQIDIDGAAVPAKGQALVARDGDRVTPLFVAAQGVKAEAGNAHVLRPGGGIQGD